MISFVNDYSEGACPEICQKLIETNLEQLPGYGTDYYCQQAAEKIKKACDCPQGEVFFLVGGTQTNKTVIDSLLEKYEGVLTAHSGHISTHEAGAIEATGHKILELPQKEGKITAEDITRYLEKFYGDDNYDHMVFPGMVYISHPTEYGTLYTKKELKEISKVCRENNLPLYMDGARLGYGLVCEDTDVELPDVAKYCDAFYFGGTKIGTFCGEAVVFTRGNTPKHFMTLMKQQGALLAKGRFLGIQFDTLFTDGLYKKLCKNALDQAEILKEEFKEKGYEFYIDSPTNQIFIVLENEKMEQLKKKVAFSFWENMDETHTVVRFATSWATTTQQVDELRKLL